MTTEIRLILAFLLTLVCLVDRKSLLFFRAALGGACFFMFFIDFFFFFCLLFLRALRSVAAQRCWPLEVGAMRTQSWYEYRA